jgi:rare lipoprotein A
MANGKAFNPDKLTAASWFYPLGTTLEIQSGGNKKRCVRVVITDRGPSRQLVKEGRIIDLSREAFRSIARLEDGLTGVTVQEVLVPTNRH